MGVLLRKKEGTYFFTKIAKLAIVGLIISIAAGSIDAIWAVYMDSFVNSTVLVGLISTILVLISFISYFLIIPWIEKGNKTKIYFFSLFLFVITYILFAINSNFYFFLFLAVFITILYTLRVTSFGIIARDYSSNSKVARNEGLLYTCANIGWVVGPLIAAYLIFSFGIGSVFLFAAGFVFLGLIFFSFCRLKNLGGKKKADYSFFKNFKDFFKDKDRVIAYLLGSGVNLWWSLIFIFVPLMIIRSGLGGVWVSYFLFAVAVPLVMFGYLFAKIAGKKGFKKMFKLAYLFIAVLSVICFFFSNIYIILSILVLASLGMAVLESTTEAYFFDILKGKERYRFYGPYNTAIDFGGFIGRGAATLALLILPFKFLFILFGIFMFLLFLLSFKTKGIVESRRS